MYAKAQCVKNAALLPNEMLPLVMISPKFDFSISATPKWEYFQAQKEWPSWKSTGPYVWAMDSENNGRKSRKGTVPATSSPEKSIFGFLRHYIQATFSINCRKSINPTILSIQIRN